MRRRRIGPDLMAVGEGALLLWDFLAVAVAALISAQLYRALFPGRGFAVVLHGSFGREVLLAACLGALLLRQFGGIASLQRPMPDRLRAAAALPAVLIAVGFATRTIGDVSRAWVLLWSATAFAFVAAGRCGLGGAMQALLRSGQLRQRIAIVGAGPLADGLIRHLRAADAQAREIVGIFDDRRSRLSAQHCLPRGTVADLMALGRGDPPDWIIIALPATAEERIAALLRELKSLCAQIAICPPHIAQEWVRPGDAGLDFLDGLPVRVLARPPLRQWQRLAKAVEDRALALVLLVALLPLMLLIALAVRLDSDGPALFRQTRQGWNNQDF